MLHGSLWRKDPGESGRSMFEGTSPASARKKLRKEQTT
jgi:hypothetical protein